MCGMTREQDAGYAVSVGVDAIGLIFYPGSSRYVTIKKAKSVVCEIPPFVSIVAVVVNPVVADLEHILNEIPVQWIQFHGDESPEFCSQFNRPYIKSVAASSTEIINQSIELYDSASAILLDTPSIQRGGVGQAFDWQLIPEKRNKPVILAGGLDASNVKRAVSLTMPYAVDVCSGIEASPGIKDHSRMLEFVNALRGDDE
jgi:phosphoribosylanthranilate isomerase